VSFLLPVHNQADTVGATLESILAQTHADFEVVVIDDASNDGTVDILRTLEARAGGRIRVHRNETNLEMTRSLILGMSLVRGRYVARIDADDLCLPERAARQAEFLDGHPDIGVVGSFIETFSDNGEAPVTLMYPTQPDAVAAGFLFRNPLAHPAVMIRREALSKHGLQYDPRFRRGQDYDLWVRCIEAGIGLANVPEVLVRYRVHAGQATRREPGVVLETGAVVRKRLLERMGVHGSYEDRALHEALSWDQLVRDAAWLRAAARWLEALEAANRASRFFDRDALARVLCGRWVRVLILAREIGAPMDHTSSPFTSCLDDRIRATLDAPVTGGHATIH
jgi:glycosyltransferase involved in cell wall biosynthesis